MTFQQQRKADSTLRSSQAVPHPSTNRALCRLTSEVRRDPVFSATVWPSAKTLFQHRSCAETRKTCKSAHVVTFANASCQQVMTLECFTCTKQRALGIARLAQSAERKALNLVVVGSSPTVGVLQVFAFPCTSKNPDGIVFSSWLEA